MSDASRTLSITRHLKAPRAAAWRCWSEGDLLKQWYCPKPWAVSEVALDLRAGGMFHSTFNGPNGEVVPNFGQFLEIIVGEKLTFTDAFVGDWQLSEKTPFVACYVTLSDADDGGTVMEWGARHWSDETVEQHKAMGFEGGWNAAADQLDELALSL